MLQRVTILYCMAWVAYAVFAVLAFPIWNTSVCIPVFLLTGLGAWIYGTTRGLIIIIPTLLFHMILLSIIHADILNWYQSNITATFIFILVVEMMGNLRKQYDRIKKTTEQLDQLVEKRNDELALLTTRLLENSENMKIAYGQELHDGIGQHLTGIQLLSASLSEQLLRESNPVASISHHLKIQTNKAHHHVRKISRLLFPVRIGQVGLVPALNELASCLNDIKPIKATVIEDKKLPLLPEHLLLQLFRICQETALYVTDHLAASRLTITVTTVQSNIVMTVEHNGNLSATASPDHGAFHLIRHRLNQINGTQEFKPEFPNKQAEQFIVPLQPMLV